MALDTAPHTDLTNMTLDPSKPAFGIDLGTTNSAIGYFSKGEVEILKTKNGSRTVPSYVSYSRDPPIVGEQAQRLMKTRHKKVVYDAKRMIGLDYKHSTVQQNMDFWTFDIVEENKRPVYDLGDGRKITPEEVSSEVLKELKRMALDRVKGIKEDEFEAVITVPDYFSQAQKTGTLKAAEIAGIKVLNLITEPTAAAFAYGYDHKRFDGYNVFVFDMGGGTTDISILEVKNGEFKVVGRAGDNQLGGRDFDNLLLNYYAKKTKNEHQLDIYEENNLGEKIRLKEVCEEVKKRLATNDEEIIELSKVKDDIPDESISSDTFKEEVRDLTTRCKKLCEQAIKECNLDISEIGEVLLVGGACRMKVVKKMLQEVFRNHDLKESINPDEAIAYGATVRAAQLLDKKASTQMLGEKLPIGIGIGLLEDQYDIILKRNTDIPSREVTKNYCTVVNNQKGMTFKIYEGERPIASKNTLLGEFTIEFPPKDSGEVSVALTMSIDKNGILTAYAKYEDKIEDFVIDVEKVISGDSVQEMLNALEINRITDRAEAEAKRARGEMRINIEHIKAICDKEQSSETKDLMEKIKGIDRWLSSTQEPLTPEIREKFINIEDKAKELAQKYNKSITSFKN